MRVPCRRQLSRFIAIAIAGLALGASSAQAEPVGQVERFPTKCGVGTLVAGPDGNVWFNCFREEPLGGGHGLALIGRITPQGQVTEFSEGIPAGLGIGGLAPGPDGNLWFTLSRGIGPPVKNAQPSAIGRITPAGVVTLFRTGLREGSVPTEIVAGPEGDLWFTDVGSPPEVGRITPAGTITEYPTGLKPPLGIGGLAVSPDGSAWFTQVYDLPHGDGEPGGLIGRVDPSGALTQFGTKPAALGAPVATPDGDVWFVGADGRTALDRVTPSGEISRFGAGTLGVPTDLVAAADGNVWFTAQQTIGRVTPSGQITQFAGCMNYRQFFSEARTIVAGPGEDLWFSSVTSRELPSIEEPPTIGRVTLSGQVTLFKAGIGLEPRSLVAGPDGRVWFSGGNDQIERITPPTAPVNTFVFAPGIARAGGAAQVPIEVPDAGRVELRPLALLLPHKRTMRLPTATIRATAPACGSTQLKLRLRGAAAVRLRKTGQVKLKVSATFTPLGGSANTEVTTVRLRERLADRRDRRR